MCWYAFGGKCLAQTKDVSGVITSSGTPAKRSHRDRSSFRSFFSDESHGSLPVGSTSGILFKIK